MADYAVKFAKTVVKTFWVKGDSPEEAQAEAEDLYGRGMRAYSTDHMDTEITVEER